jgi:hypothetical protein
MWKNQKRFFLRTDSYTTKSFSFLTTVIFLEILPRPVDKSVVGSRWMYKVKQTANESVEKYKAIFVVWGFSLIKGIDYDETFAPVAR